MAVIAVRNVFDHDQVFLIDCQEKDHTLNGATFCDELLVLPPGVYEIIVQSQDPDCRTEFDHYKVIVEEGQTVEVPITLVCQNNGGLDVIVTTRNRPAITGISFLGANKFICAECEGQDADVRVEVQVSDPDTACNLLTPTWTVVDGNGDPFPGLLSDFQMVPGDPCRFSALIDAGAPLDDYEITFSVTDGTTPASSITFPVHIIYCGCGEDISIIKYTNGFDANNPPGPYIQVGDPVSWTYFVTNTGTQTLHNVTVTDSVPGVVVTCPDTILDPGEAMACSAQGIAQPGQYANVGTVVGTPPLGPPVQDDDPSHYYGMRPSIEIVKYTDDAAGVPQDADLPPGPSLTPGTQVHWSYVVTNTGDVTLTNVTVFDSEGVPVTCPSTTLAPGASMTCNAYGIAQAGQYENIGFAEGNPPAGPPVTDDNPSHYNGGEGPAIHIVKYVIDANGVPQDANFPPGPTLTVGSTVQWQYFVKNIGNVQLTNVTVTDDQGVIVTCPDTILDPGPMGNGESMICTASGTVTAGQYTNLATATGTPPTGPNVTDQDPANYFGAPQQFCLGEACTFVILGLENARVGMATSFLSINSANEVYGDIGYSAGITSTVNQKIGSETEQPPDVWIGGAYVHSAFTAFSYTDKNYFPSNGIHIGGASDARLDEANDDAYAAYLAWVGLPQDATDTLNITSGSPDTITAAAGGDNFWVVDITSVSCNDGTLTLNGNNTGKYFILRVDGDFDWSGCTVALTGGLTADQVIWLFPDAGWTSSRQCSQTPSDIVINKAETVFNGTILAPCASLLYHNPAQFNGKIIGSDITLHSDFNITHVPPTVPCQ